MKILTPGHKYVLESMEGTAPQTLQFIEKAKRCEPDCAAAVVQGAECDCQPKFVTINDGTTNEEVLAVLIDRLKSLNAKLPNAMTTHATILLECALGLLEYRTAERKARGVEGSPKP